MKKDTLFIFLIITVILSLIFLSGCGEEKEAEVTPPPKVEGESKKSDAGSSFALNSNKSDSFNPYQAQTQENRLVGQLVYENIFEVDENYNLSSNVVLEKETRDNMWIFKIDTSIKMHDGSNLTAKDLTYSLSQAFGSRRFNGRFNTYQGAMASGDDTLIVSTTKPNKMLPYVLNVPIIKAGQAKEITPIGCGPYMFSEDGNSLVAFDEYKKRDTLPFDIIELKEYETIEERIDAFEDGEVNLVVNDRTGKNSLGYGGKNEIRYFTTLNLHYFGFNMADEFVSKPGVRYAMQFALNREEAAKVFLNNNALPTVAAVHPRSELYSQDLARSVNYNMDSCLTSFNNAGVTDADNDGKLENMMYGIPVEINVDLIVCADGAGKGDIARKFAKELSTIGVTVSVRELSWQDYNTALQEGEFDMYYAEVRIPGDFNIQNMFEEEGSLNFGKILDDELIYVIDDFLAAGDDTRADKCYNMMNVFLNKSPIIPICFERRELIMHRNFVTGVDPCDGNVFFGVANWRIH